MKRFKKGLFRLGAAALAAVMLSSCDTHSAEWEDTLPSPVTTSAAPAVNYITEETTTTEEITLPTRESTSRTAATSPTPELATTTNPPTDPIDGTTAVSTIPGIPRVPISEFTSTTPAASTSSTPLWDTEPSSSYSGLDSSDSTFTFPAVTEETLIQTAALLPEVTDPFAAYTAREEIIRPYSYRVMTDEKYIYIYDTLVTAIDKRRTNINFSGVMAITIDDYLAVYQQLYNDEMNMFFLDPKFQYAENVSTKTLTAAVMSYKHSSETIDSMEAEIETEVNRVLSGITPEMSQYDIVKYFHDYICENIVYDNEADNCSNIYGAFVGKRALCQGMAKAFSYLCSKVGIETLTITGMSDGLPHMWNMVKLGGEWYHIDPTYDNADNANYGRYVRYDYFCVDSETIRAKRTIDGTDYEYPEATATRCNYYVKNGLVGTDLDSVKKILTEQVVKSAEGKKVTAQVKCADKAVYDEAMDKLFGAAEKQAIGVMEDALTMSENKFRTNNISFAYDDVTFTITLYLDYTD
ncbi:MAG: hypothetical protein NC253_07995 [Ruminococcus sp.]|nr:hypothetical protein [Ruminococcus sp.]MCM1478172.1 hypothetical protein [Muribaculaceae bacterium]